MCVNAELFAAAKQINKPIVEKKRRERINACLDELKDLLLQSASKHEVRIAVATVRQADYAFAFVCLSVSGTTRKVVCEF